MITQLIVQVNLFARSSHTPGASSVWALPCFPTGKVWYKRSCRKSSQNQANSSLPPPVTSSGRPKRACGSGAELSPCPVQSALVWLLLFPWLPLWWMGFSSPPLSTTNPHHDFVCIFYMSSTWYNPWGTVWEGKWIPARTKGSGWPASALSLADVVLTQLRILLRGKGLELILGAALGGANIPCHLPHFPASGSMLQHDPAGLYICMTQPIVFICVGILKWLEGSESPHAVPTENLCFQWHFLHKWLGYDSQCVSGLQCVLTKLSML